MFREAPRGEVRWPVRVGTVPALASAFQPRASLRERIEQGYAGHGPVLLSQVLSGGGGVGKSQLAAACVHEALTAGTELVVWLNAAEPAEVPASYATAAHRVQAPGATGQDADADARAFLDWLATTSRSWLVVLDDLTDIDHLNRGLWWPPAARAGNGRTLATTRLRGAQISGAGRTVIGVDTYTADEALAYLQQRLTDADAVHLLDGAAAGVIDVLGGLPLGLAHAAAYMINEELPCARYRELLTDRRSRLRALLPRDADTEGYGREITAALLLTLDAADRQEPVGLARPAIRLAACLDPAGHPQMFWTDNAVTDYLTTYRTPSPATSATSATSAPEPVTADQARAAMRLLHRYGLITSDTRHDPHAVRIHALTARAARETTPTADVRATVLAVADALHHIWPEAEHTDPALAAVLRTNTETLAAHAGDLLWQTDCHPVLHQAGKSLSDAWLYAAAITHWSHLAHEADRLLGSDHPDTLTARAGLAASYRMVGREQEAVPLEEQVVADSQRLLGGDHPHTLAARAGLAASYREVGREQESVAIQEQVAADRDRVLGSDHPDTLIARGDLAHSYREEGRVLEAIAIEEQVVADSERLLRSDHPDTLAARDGLARSYWMVGRMQEAISIEEHVAAGRERLLGSDHPDTVAARGNLALFYREVGRVHEAISLLEQAAADFERLLGSDHPHTLNARAHLAHACREAGQVREHPSR